MKSKFSSKILPIYYLLIIGLFLYSFTQISLGLALTRYPNLFSIQRVFQEIGYFNRPLSTLLFLLLIIGLFIIYIVFFKNKNIFKERKKIWYTIFFTAILLLFSYPAFSFDIFNYIFDARIFTHYGKNPYAYKALDFPRDPMLGFMHWTHRTYPYGPSWLLISIPISYVGLQLFLPTLFLFKTLIVLGYLGSIYYIEKIVRKISPGNETKAMVFFAFNPLIIIESLVSGHHDILMIFFALASLYFILERKYIGALVIFLLSAGIKYVTIFLFPIFLAIVVMQRIKGKVPWMSFIGISLICMSLGVLAASQYSGNFQPWYLLFVLPFVSLVVTNPFLIAPSIILSIGALMTYTPYLYLGNWDKPVPDFLRILYLSSIGISLLATFLLIMKRRASN